MNKYGARRGKAPDGQVFDSAMEYHRYCLLKLLERAGKISDLKRQVSFELIPKQEGKIKLHKWLVYEDEVEELEEEAEVQETAAAPTVDENAELKPCPFCGGKASVIKESMWYEVHCDNCPCNVGRCWFSKREEAIEAWNRREEDGI